MLYHISMFKFNLCLFLVFGLAFMATLQAQPPLPGAKISEKNLAPDPNISFEQYLAMVNGYTATVLRDAETQPRLDAHDSLFNTLQIALMMPEADTCLFENRLKGISVQRAPKGKFSIFTWQLFVDDSSYRYGGMIRMDDGKIFRLTDKANEVKQPFTTRLRHDNWYGALYYKMLPFTHNDKEMYLLIGYNAHSFFTRRKLIDVLYFENDKPRFGYNVLQMKDGMGKVRGVQRFIMEYSASVTVSLNYSEADKMIIYDHLIGGSPIEGGGMTNVPDGSYCGLKLEKGNWVYIDKLHEDNYDPKDPNSVVPLPVDKPLFNENTKKRNIFGRDKKGN